MELSVWITGEQAERGDKTMTAFSVSEAVSAASIDQSCKSGWLTRAFRAAARAYRVGRCRRALSALSDHTLKDIGIARSEIDCRARMMADRGDDPVRLPPSMWIRG
jgi:uncharacterized protein YjiS (DUF1127 family)